MSATGWGIMPTTKGTKAIQFVGDGVLLYKAPSTSRYGIFHYVMLLNGTEIKCSCEGFVYAGHCWHADQMAEMVEDRKAVVDIE